ncbi:unnamed protein product, partial [Clonostachys rosea]
CDGNYPTCSHCERARVQCVGLDRGSEVEVPRSLVYYLEELVAQLELERGRLARNRPDSEGTTSQCNDIQPNEPLFSAATVSAEQFKTAYNLAAITAKESAPACSIGNRPRHVLPYYKTFFMNAELPFPLAFGSHRTIDVPSLSNGSSFTQLPDEVADKLMGVYLNRISPQYPIFSREDVNDIFGRFKLSASNPQMVTPDERFIIWMIMAIAVLSSTADDYRKLASVAESLRRNAFSHFDFGSQSNHATTTTIRQLLLLLQYGFLLPSSTNLWQVAGDAMRIAVGLGLHQDTPAESGFAEETVQSRKKLFWTLYALERSIAITSHRPYAIAGDQIHTSFLVSEDFPVTPDETSGKAPYIRFFDRLKFLRIQSEICSVNIGMRPPPNSHLTHETWIADTERRISDAMAHAVDPDWCMFMCRHATLLLHMPCARSPAPCERSIMKYFDAAVCTARAYWDLIESNNLDCPWHATHHCYEAGNLILYSLWHFRDLIKKHFTTNQVFEVVHQISGFFILVATRWAAAQHCGLLFDRLRTGALSFFRDENTSDPEQSFEARQLRELVFRENADLLYAREQPSPSVIGPSTFPTVFPEFEIDQLFVDNNTDFLNFLHLSDDVPVFDESCPEDMEMDVGHLDLPLAPQGPSLEEPNEPKKLMIDEAQFRALLLKIPVCSHCKRRRIKCDKNLPSCANCTRLNQECCYWDRASGEEASRNHVHALKLHAENLMTEIKELDRPVFVSNAHTSANVLEALAVAQPKAATSQPRYPNILTGGASDTAPESDIIPYPLFFGHTSSFARLVNIVGQRSVLLREDEITTSAIRSPAPSETICSSVILKVATDMPPDEARNLAWHYYRSIELVYPILGQELLHQTLDLTYSSPSSSTAGKGSLIHVRLYLVLAISLSLIDGKDQRLQIIADAYFAEAVSTGISRDYFVFPTTEALQLVLLLCVYAWMCPSSMDIWRLLGHASRMCLDIMEVHGSDKTRSSTASELYRTLYALENQVCICLGRPHQLPDGDEPPVSSPDVGPVTAGEMPSMVYKLARVQCRLHRDAIGHHSGREMQGLELESSPWPPPCVGEVKAWLENWNVGVETLCHVSPSPYKGDLKPLLKFWGISHYCQAVLLAKLVADQREEFPISSENELEACKELLYAIETLCQSSTPLIRGSLAANMLLQVFPWTWTHSHLLYTALMVLLQHMQDGQLPDSETRQLFHTNLERLVSLEQLGSRGATGLASCLNKIIPQYY